MGGYLIVVIYFIFFLLDNNNVNDTQAHSYNSKVGIINFVDGIGQLHGTWGGFAVNPEIDEIEIIG